MRPLFRASLLERMNQSLETISRASRTPRGLAVICICWVLFLLVLVFAFTRQTSWETPTRAYAASSTAASLLVSDSDGSMDRKLCYSALPLCEELRSYSEGEPLFSELKTVCVHECNEVMTWNS